MVVVEIVEQVVMVVIELTMLDDHDVSWFCVVADHHHFLLLLEETLCLQLLIFSSK